MKSKSDQAEQYVYDHIEKSHALGTELESAFLAGWAAGLEALAEFLRTRDRMMHDELNAHFQKDWHDRMQSDGDYIRNRHCISPGVLLAEVEALKKGSES
jgi:hypothetical protein